MNYNGTATLFFHMLNHSVFAVITASCLILTGCDNSGSGNKSTASGQTVTTPETPATAPETAAAEAPVTPVANEEMQMTEENTPPVVAAETTDTGTEQPAAESTAQEREPMSGRDA